MGYDDASIISVPSIDTMFEHFCCRKYSTFTLLEPNSVDESVVV